METENQAIEEISKKPTAGRPRKSPATDAKEVISSNGTVLLMTSATGSWTTGKGVEFTQERPYQFVENDEIEPLIGSGRFRRADPEEVKNFYRIEL